MIKSRFNTLVMKKEVDKCDKDLFLDITLKTPLNVDEVLKIAKTMGFYFQEFHCMGQICEIVTYFRVKTTSKEEVKEYLKQLKKFSDRLDEEIHNSLMSIFYWDYSEDRFGEKMGDLRNKITNHFLQTLCKEDLKTSDGKILKEKAEKNNFDWDKTIEECSFVSPNFSWQELLAKEELLIDGIRTKDDIYLLMDCEEALDDTFIEECYISKQVGKEIQFKIQKKLIEICQKLDIEIKNYFNKEWLEEYLSA